ncbi:MAG: glycosyltransferase family 2 protein [Planctomycetota bacterium]
MKLAIVIPAYNEEDAIASIIERCLAARPVIIAESPVSAVEIVVVSDGSTDRTVEIASRFVEDIKLIEFDRNRGYGAAIKRGFHDTNGDLVGFLDADGTCDPCYFAVLCNALIEDSASVAIGSRMGPQSKMPPIRRLGNRIYATMLSLLSNQKVSDTASGMRVIRRDALRSLYPLPDGLHFTPAMSARVLMDQDLSIVERPMPYEERIGESKLSVLRDGVRFLRTILEMTLMWRPSRLFVPASIICLVSMVMLAMHPIESWLRLGSFDESMIYRLLFCSLLGTVGVSLLSATVLADNFHRLVSGEPEPRTFRGVLLERVFSFGGLIVASTLALPLLIWLIGSGIYTRIADGFVDLHWSRVVLAGLIVFSLTEMLLTVLLANIIRFHATRRQVGATGKAARAEVGATSLVTSSGESTHALTN